MLPISVQHVIKRFGIALAVPLSLLLTLTALFGSSTAQANHDISAMPAMSSMPSMPAMPADLPSVPAARQTSTGPAALSGIVDVSIVYPVFDPSVITITAGSEVRWTNLNTFTHTTTSDIGSLVSWDSHDLGPGKIFPMTFSTPGTYNYHCEIHPFMHGTVVVVPPPQPPTEVDVTGPSNSATTLPQTFTAAVDPITATQPITYIWEATNQTTMTNTDKGLSDTLTFTWPKLDIGPQMITVTAVNDFGSVSATHAITLVPPSNIYLPLVLR